MASIEKLTQLAKQHLEPEEKVLSVVKGTYDAAMFGERRNTLRRGILIATEEKVVLYCKKFTGYELKFYPYGNLSSIEMDKGTHGHSVAMLVFGSEPLTMQWIRTGEEAVTNFVEVVKSNIMRLSQERITSESGMDIPDQIRKLADLKNDGILTEEEFELKKQELLVKL